MRKRRKKSREGGKEGGREGWRDGGREEEVSKKEGIFGGKSRRRNKKMEYIRN